MPVEERTKVTNQYIVFFGEKIIMNYAPTDEHSKSETNFNKALKLASSYSSQSFENKIFKTTSAFRVKRTFEIREIVSYGGSSATNDTKIIIEELIKSVH